MQQRVIDGTGAELQEHLRQHPEDRFRLILLSTKKDPSSEASVGKGIRRGMFPQLRSLTEADFKKAEWQGEDSNL